MKILLDSNVWIWLLGNQRRLSEERRSLLSEPSNEIFVSTASFWELTIKARAGKLEVDSEVMEATRTMGIQILDIKPDHIMRLQELPFLHRDPFDHLLMATAISEQAAFLTSDSTISKYQGIAGLQIISA